MTTATVPARSESRSRTVALEEEEERERREGGRGRSVTGKRDESERKHCLGTASSNTQSSLTGTATVTCSATVRRVFISS